MAEIMSSQPPAKPTANCSGFGSRKCDVILADCCTNASVPTNLRMMLPTTTGRRPTPDACPRSRNSPTHLPLPPPRPPHGGARSRNSLSLLNPNTRGFGRGSSTNQVRDLKILPLCRNRQNFFLGGGVKGLSFPIKSEALFLIMATVLSTEESTFMETVLSTEESQKKAVQTGNRKKYPRLAPDVKDK